MRTISFMNESFTFIHRLSKDLRRALTYCPAIAALGLMNCLIVLVPFCDILRNVFTWWLKKGNFVLWRVCDIDLWRARTQKRYDHPNWYFMNLGSVFSWLTKLSFCLPIIIVLKNPSNRNRYIISLRISHGSNWTITRFFHVWDN
jgi:hypothetical protein